ncbi:hypothetical protein Barb4_02285 [Bacteroidales bacterium Barb4]|nr:hypothetical protein Barb4_02285 [Bacteroidales bacterium Barb4]
MKRRILLAGLCLCCMFQAMGQEPGIFYNGVAYHLYSDNTATIADNRPYGGGRHVVIPPTITIDHPVTHIAHTYTVTGIAVNAFQGIGIIESIVLPEGITNIPRRAFKDCGALYTVTLPNSVRSIDDEAFKDASLLDLYLQWNDGPSGRKIGKDALAYKSGSLYCRLHIPKGTERMFGWNPESITCYWLEKFYIQPNRYEFTYIDTNDSTMGSIDTTIVPLTMPWSREELLYARTRVQLRANPYYGYHFVKWGDEHDRSLTTDKLYEFIVSGDVPFLRAHFAADSFHVSLSADDNGTIIKPESGEGTYAYKTEAKAEAAAKVNYHFVKWTNARGDSLSADNPYTFVVTKDTVLKAHFELDNCWIQLSAGEHGGIKSGGGTYPFYSQVTIEAVPDSGYHFVKWSDTRNDNLSADNPYTFVADGDRDIQAHFGIDNYRVSAFANANGGIKSGGGNYKPGTEATIEAEAAAHYHFVKWTDKNGDSLSADNPFRFIVTMDTVVRAHFAENYYRVSLSAGENGAIRAGEGLYLHDTRVLAEAAADTGYYFVKWTTAGGDSVSVFNPYAFAVKGDIAFQAHFAANSYHVTWSAGENGRIKSGDGTAKSGGGAYAYNAKVTTEAVADANYHFVKWVNGRGDSLSADNPYTFAVKGDVAVQARFAVGSSYRVSLSAAEHGSIKSGDRTYVYNTKAEVEAAADTRYHFVKWTNAAGDSVSGENPYAFVVKEATALRAHFDVNRYRVTLSAKNGMITSGGGTYEYEAVAEAEAEAYYGYRLLKWTDAKGDSLSADNPFVFLVEGDADMRAVFMPRSYRLTVSAGEHGDVAPAGDTGLYEEYMKVHAVADDGYHFARWTDARGDSVSARNPYEFQLVRNTELTAVFEGGSREFVMVTASATGGGRVLGGGEYEYGNWVTLIAIADPQYYFTGWTRDGIPVSKEADYVFTLTRGGSNSYRAGFEKYMTGSSLPLPDGGEARAYYADRVLRLANLGGHIISVGTADGRQVLQFKADGAEYQCPVTLPAGVYILNAASGKGRYVTKFVVW